MYMYLHKHIYAHFIRCISMHHVHKSQHDAYQKKKVSHVWRRHAKNRRFKHAPFLSCVVLRTSFLWISAVSPVVFRRHDDTTQARPRPDSWMEGRMDGCNGIVSLSTASRGSKRKHRHSWSSDDMVKNCAFARQCSNGVLGYRRLIKRKLAAAVFIEFANVPMQLNGQNSLLAQRIKALIWWLHELI